MSLQKKLLLRLFAILCVSAILISIVAFVLAQQPLLDELNRSRSDILTLLCQRIDMYRNNLISIANLFASDSQLLNAVYDEISDDSVAAEEHIQKLYETYQNTFGDMGFYVIVIAENGFEYCSRSNTEFGKLRTLSWHMRNIVNHKDSYFVTNYNDYYVDGTQNFVLGAVRVLRDTDGSYAGTIMVCLPEIDFFNIYSDIVDVENSIYILDELSRVVSHKDKELLGQTVFPIEDYSFLYGSSTSVITIRNGQRVLLTKYKSPESDWMVVEEISYASILAPMMRLVYSMAVLCAAICVVLLFFSLRMARFVSRPISSFCEEIANTAEGDMKGVEVQSSYREIEMLGEEYNRMLDKLRVQMEESLRLEQMRRKAETDFLRAQISPHFLYNTLFSIQCTIDMGRNEDASRMIHLLILLLREMVREKEECTLMEELSLQRRYLELLQLRYRDEIELEIDVPDELMEAQIIRGILQPILENALFHGLEPQGGGRVEIRALESGGSLCIEVCDNGVGMGKEAFEKVLRNGEKRSGGGIGLYNVHNRIVYHYGVGFGIEYCELAEDVQGTCIRVRLPLGM